MIRKTEDVKAVELDDDKEIDMYTEMMAETRTFTEELKAMPYPTVWIGKVRMTPEEYLWMEEEEQEEEQEEETRRETWEGLTTQDRREKLDGIPEYLRERVPKEMFEEPPAKWDDLPEWLREDERLRQDEWPLDLEPGEVVEVEDGEEGIQIGYEYLDGLYVVENLRSEMDPGRYADLYEDVSFIRAAKQGRVRVEVAWDVEFKPYYMLSAEDKQFIQVMTEDGMAMVYLGIRYEDIPLEELTPEIVDDDLLNNLRFHVSHVEPYVIRDTARTRAALEERLAADPGEE